MTEPGNSVGVPPLRFLGRSLVVDPEGSSESRTHWQLTAHELLTATMLHLKYMQKMAISASSETTIVPTLHASAHFLSDPRRQIDLTLKEMLTARHLPSGSHPLISSTARAMLDKAPEELSGVVSTALSYLSLYRDPLVAEDSVNRGEPAEFIDS